MTTRTKRTPRPLALAWVVTVCLTASASVSSQENPEQPPPERWRQVAGTDSASFYLRRAPIEIIDKLARTWVLTNLNEPEFDSATQKHYRSTLDLEEHDCREKRGRVLQSTAYADLSARGVSIYSSTRPFEWRYARPDSIGERINDEVCAAFQRQVAARPPKKPATAVEKPTSERPPKATVPVQKL